MSHRLAGSMVALVTPFKDDRIDEAAFIALCRRQLRLGSGALVPCGTTGEAPTLSPAEQVRLIELAVEAAAGRVPVLAGAGCNGTANTIAMVRAAAKAGADAALCVVPYYNRPTQEGLYRHFAAVVAEGGLPIVLYDVPARTGVALALETIVRLARLPGIIGLKDASGDLARAARLRFSLPPEFLRLCGDDSQLAAHLELGCHGCISVTANVTPALCAAIHTAWATRDLARFEGLAAELSDLNRALFAETNPIPVKWALARLGLIGDELRLPLTPLSERHQPALRAALRCVMPAEARVATSDGAGLRPAA